QIVQRDGQLDHAEAGAEMAAGDRYGIDRLLPQLIGELAQLGGIETTEILGRRTLIEQRRFRRLRHARSPRNDASRRNAARNDATSGRKGAYLSWLTPEGHESAIHPEWHSRRRNGETGASEPGRLWYVLQC